MRWHQSLTATLLFLAALAAAAANAPAPRHTFAVQNGQFVLDGKPFQVISGEMEYARIPRAYWRDRLQKAKAMGLNAITAYVFWNEHEPRPGVYDFSGNNDIAEFIRETQQEGLYVILRSGPYICAEWDLGGYPAWLLKDHSLVLRSRDPKYMAATERWLKRLSREVAPLQIGNGGPIILVQVENEYGSFGNDHAYMEQMRQMLVDDGFTKSQIFTADGPEQIPDGSLSGVPAGIDFGNTGGSWQAETAPEAFATLKRFRPDGPFFSSEFWVGSFDHWGEPHRAGIIQYTVENLDWILRHGYSVSLYMFHGGTSFGWMNGANIVDGKYEPDVTSYDYDAPLDESGRPTKNYHALRGTISRDTGINAPPVPASPPTIKIPEFKFKRAASLWRSLPAPAHSAQILSMEDLNQAYGYILYRTWIKQPVSGELFLDQLHDYAQIYLNGNLVGTLDRRLGRNHMPLEVKQPNTRLDILVENSGRINFTAALRGERKGITSQVTLAGRRLTGWDIYTLPMMEPSRLSYSQTACSGACFYKAVLNVAAPGDTFLDTSAFSKGQVWLNGHAPGRVWNIGPQKTLYAPAPWFHKGKNEVIVFDLNGAPDRTMIGRDRPILGYADSQIKNRSRVRRLLVNCKMVNNAGDTEP